MSDVEKPHKERVEDKNASAAEAREGNSNGGGVAGDENGDALSSEQLEESSAEASGLAEDLLGAPSNLPTCDPVRIEMAACLKRFMLDVITPPAWVLEVVFPGSTEPVVGLTERQLEEVIREPMPQPNIDVVFQGVQRVPTHATPSNSRVPLTAAVPPPLNTPTMRHK